MEGTKLDIKAIFFDLDDTLNDHLWPFFEAFTAVFPIYKRQVHMESV